MANSQYDPKPENQKIFQSEYDQHPAFDQLFIEATLYWNEDYWEVDEIKASYQGFGEENIIEALDTVSVEPHKGLKKISMKDFLIYWVESMSE